MSNDTTFAGFAARLRQFISELTPPFRSSRREEAQFNKSESRNPKSEIDESAATEKEFNALALCLFALQFEHNPVLRRLCQHRGVTPATVTDWRNIPAVPTSAFKELEVTSLPPTERTTVFHSSGTTEQKPSRHFHNAASLAIYEASLLPWFRLHLLPNFPLTRPTGTLSPTGGEGWGEGAPLLSLTPPPSLAPHSSLVHMLATVSRVFGAEDSLFAGGVDASGAWTLDVDAAFSALRQCEGARRPVALLGTAFNFIHLLDALASQSIQLQLPAGSRVMETGGYKGRSRVVPKAELHALITQHLGIPASHIVCEYGMSELSSQAYDRITHHASRVMPRCFHFPPWARVQMISPETGREVADGETGLIRVVDLANVRSVLAIQTEDLGVRRGNGFELLGRALAAEPRGCSLMSLEDLSP